MAKIIGIRPSKFTGTDGKEVSGTNIYMTYPLDKGTGLGAERVYITDNKLAQWSYKPVVGDEVTVEYNRFGKCSELRKAVK